MKRVVASILIGLFFLGGCSTTAPTRPAVDALIFSYDRPMQLFALLESIEKYVTGLNEIHVIYRASSPEFKQAYARVFHTYPAVKNHAQGSNPSLDFKPLTLNASFNSPADYILFAVDDIVMKEMVDLNICIHALEKYSAYGFFLRLGTHLTDSYPTKSKQPLPPLDQVEPGIYSWQFAHGTHDWGYPNTVDMTIYRKKDIEKLLRQLPFDNPNRLEGNWSGFARTVAHKCGLCFENSKMVNLPLNRVQHTYVNRSMNEYSPQDLLEIFNQNKKIDIGPLALVKNKAAHMEYTPTFIEQ